MSKDINNAIGGVIKAGTVLLPINPPVVMAVAVSVSCILLAGSMAYKLAASGKNVKFDIFDVMKFEAEFYRPE